jgi:hypothetical protein
MALISIKRWRLLLVCLTLSSALLAQTDREEPQSPQPELAPENSGEETAEAGGNIDSGDWANETIPEVIRRPQRREAPRYPKDTVIGSLGQGDVSEEAYRFTRNILQALLVKNTDSRYLAGMGGQQKEDILAIFETAIPRTFHAGGGREEPDGSVSFLFRFIGPEQSVAGELYLWAEEEAWRFEDIVIEDAQEIAERGDAYRFDFSPYERFF